jgi:hypothetical protein
VQRYHHGGKVEPLRLFHPTLLPYS